MRRLIALALMVGGIALAEDEVSMPAADDWYTTKYAPLYHDKPWEKAAEIAGMFGSETQLRLRDRSGKGRKHLLPRRHRHLPGLLLDLQHDRRQPAGQLLQPGSGGPERRGDSRRFQGSRGQRLDHRCPQTDIRSQVVGPARVEIPTFQIRRPRQDNVGVVGRFVVEAVDADVEVDQVFVGQHLLR